MTKVRQDDGNYYKNVCVINCKILPNPDPFKNPFQEMKCFIGHRDEKGYAIGLDYEIVNGVRVPYGKSRARQIELNPSKEWDFTSDFSFVRAGKTSSNTHCKVYTDPRTSFKELYCMHKSVRFH